MPSLTTVGIAGAGGHPTVVPSATHTLTVQSRHVSVQGIHAGEGKVVDGVLGASLPFVHYAKTPEEQEKLLFVDKGRAERQGSIC